jgi:RNA recognition motif-containing protein
MAASQQNRDHGIAVKGISDDITEDDLFAAFGFAGNIAEVFIKAERGYAFVTFEATGSVQQAVDGAPAEVAGVSVRVEARTPARVREEAPVSVNVYINGLAGGVTAEDVQAGVAPFGAVDIDAVFVNDDKNIAFVAFETEDAAAAAVAASGSIVVAGQATGACEFRRSKANGGRRGGGSRKRSGRKAKAIPENSVYVCREREGGGGVGMRRVMRRKPTWWWGGGVGGGAEMHGERERAAGSFCAGEDTQ